MSASIQDLARVTDLVEPGQSGDWRVDRVTISAEDARIERLRALSNGGRHAREGTYTRLSKHGALVMSDTHDELRDLSPLRWHARGRVLINGLGLGCALKLCLSLPEVEHVDVVEISPDVIALTGPYFKDERVAIHEGDAYTFRFPPRTRWNAAWHDVWNDISADNDFATLHRRYGRRCDWQGSWCRHQAEYGRFGKFR